MEISFSEPTMNGKLATLPLLALLALAMSGCVPKSDNPLSDPETAKIDDGLLGKWEASMDRIFIVEKMAKAGYPAGAMLVKMYAPAGGEKALIAVCFATELKGRRFASILNPDTDINDPKDLPTWEKLRATKRGYDIHRYDVDAKELTIYAANMDALETAAKKLKIGGKMVGERPAPTSKWKSDNYFHFNETTARLGEFLATDEAERAFSKFDHLVYKRSK